MDRIRNMIMMVAAAMLSAGVAWGGSLDAPAAPTAAGSAMFTTTDLYNRLASGAAGAKRIGPFTEPSGAPAPTGYSTNQLMAAAPAADNLNGAILSYVLVTKTFWGLRTDGTWGTQTGTRPPAPVPKTGQTTCYDPIDGYNNPPAACAYSSATLGEDGSLMRGVPVIGPRFTDHGNGTVTDNLSGLIWLKDAMCNDAVGGIDKSPEKENLTWSDALLWTRGLAQGKCGLTDGSKATDWRLPNVKELQSLIDFGHSSPALPAGHPFLNTNLYQPQWYYSSTVDMSGNVNVWDVDITYGLTGSEPYTTLYYVWPVRGGLSQ